jgi:hypothetical protein
VLEKDNRQAMTIRIVQAKYFISIVVGVVDCKDFQNLEKNLFAGNNRNYRPIKLNHYNPVLFATHLGIEIGERQGPQQMYNSQLTDDRPAGVLNHKTRIK